MGGVGGLPRKTIARSIALLLGCAVAAALGARASAATPGRSAAPLGDLEPAGAPWLLDGVRFTVADDRFRKPDDAGFTSYQAVTAQLSRGAGERFSLTVANQMITERGGRRRVDEGSVVGEYARRGVASGFGLELALHGGLGVQANLGGAQVQDAFHALVGGRRLGSRLQDEYPERPAIGGLAGGLARVRWPGRGPVALTAGAGGRIALGGGVSHLGGSLGVALDSEHLRAEAGADVRRFFSRDPYLTMPGGYVTGAFVASPFLRIAVRRRGLEVEYEARADVGGSGQGLSQLSLRLPLR